MWGEVRWFVEAKTKQTACLRSEKLLLLGLTHSFAKVPMIFFLLATVCIRYRCKQLAWTQPTLDPNG